MQIELIVFDLAGTTVKDNNDVHKVLKHSLSIHGVEITVEDANEVMGIPKPVAIEYLLNKYHTNACDITKEWISEIHDTFVDQMIDFYERDESVGEKEGVSNMFKKLKWNNIKVVVDTGFDRPVAASLLKRLGWIEGNLIDASVTSDEVVRGRPYPDLIFRAMELADVTDVRKVAKVGDTVSDLREGTSAGCGMVIGVTSGAFSEEDLRKEDHTHLVENVPEILEILNIK